MNETRNCLYVSVNITFLVKDAGAIQRSAILTAQRNEVGRKPKRPLSQRLTSFLHFLYILCTDKCY